MDGQVNQIDGVTNPHDAVPEDGHGPIPPRYWWLKRISIGVGVLLVAVVFLRLWWGWEADRRLQAEIDRIVAAGEPFYPEDYVEDVPDELNAALLYEEAATTFQALPNSKVDVLGLYGDPRSYEEHLEEIRALVELNRSVLSLMHEARSLADVNWTNLGNTNQALNVANYSGARTLSKFLVATAAAQYFENDHHALIETQRDSLAFGEALARRSILVGGLVAIANHALAFRVVEEFSSDLIIESADMGNRLGRPATRTAILKLVEDLLAEKHDQDSLR
ncbi:MAG: hypothetical protein IH897_09540, partial [Planctomycetes bacterium]|nr:hypothetical protein [Planctomycetota bacterium]